jgi:hypothetical protein
MLARDGERRLDLAITHSDGWFRARNGRSPETHHAQLDV